VSALGEGSSARLGRLLAFGQTRELRRLLNGMVGGAVLVGLVGVAVSVAGGKTILTLLYKAEYATGAQLLVWLSVAAMAANVASIVSYGMISVRKYRDHLASLIAMAAATAAGCWLLVPSMGLNGAAAALLMGYGLQAGWGLVACRLG
jgi:O-antigen/teichoic acid export membrane protein